MSMPGVFLKINIHFMFAEHTVTSISRSACTIDLLYLRITELYICRWDNYGMDVYIYFAGCRVKMRTMADETEVLVHGSKGY